MIPLIQALPSLIHPLQFLHDLFGIDVVVRVLVEVEEFRVVVLVELGKVGWFDEDGEVGDKGGGGGGGRGREGRGGGWLFSRW